MAGVQKKSTQRVKGVEGLRHTAPDRKNSTACINQSFGEESQCREAQGREAQARAKGDGRTALSTEAAEAKVERPHREDADADAGSIPKKKQITAEPPAEQVPGRGPGGEEPIPSGSKRRVFKNLFAESDDPAERESAARSVCGIDAIDRTARPGICEGISAERIEFIKLQGTITDERSHIDWEERRKYIELATRLRGLLNQPKVNVEMNGDIQVVIEHIGGK